MESTAPGRRNEIYQEACWDSQLGHRSGSLETAWKQPVNSPHSLSSIPRLLSTACQTQMDGRRSRRACVFVYDPTGPVHTRVFFPPTWRRLNPVSADERRPVLAATLRRGQQEGQEMSRRCVNAIAAQQIRAGGLPACLWS